MTTTTFEVIVVILLAGILGFCVATTQIVLRRFHSVPSEPWVPSSDVFVLKVDHPLNEADRQVISENLLLAIESGAPIILTEGAELVRL